MNANTNPMEGQSARLNAPAQASTITTTRAAQTAGLPVKRRILVVDDDPVILKSAEMRLKAHGYAVTTAADGPSAIHSARSEHPDLILLDLNFPPDLALTWDGFSIMNWLRRLDSTKNVPIIIFTGLQGDSYYQRANAAGAAGFFHKPLDYAPLLALIERRLKSTTPSQPLNDRAAGIGSSAGTASKD